MKLRRRMRQLLARLVMVSFVTGPVIVFLLERFSLYNRPSDSVIMRELAMVDGVFDGNEANQITFVQNDMELLQPGEIVYDDEEEDKKALAEFNTSIQVGPNGIVYHNDIEDDPLSKDLLHEPLEIVVPEESPTDEGIGPGELVYHDRLEPDADRIIYHDKLDPEDTEIVYHNHAEVGPAGVIYHNEKEEEEEEVYHYNLDDSDPRKAPSQNSANEGMKFRQESRAYDKQIVHHDRNRILSGEIKQHKKRPIAQQEFPRKIYKGEKHQDGDKRHFAPQGLILHNPVNTRLKIRNSSSNFLHSKTKHEQLSNVRKYKHGRNITK